jgi:Ca-activated chloride channel homolog
MKQLSVISYKLSVFLIFSVIFSACSSTKQESAQVVNKSSEADQSEGQRATSVSNTSTAANMPASVAKSAPMTDSEQKRSTANEKYAEIDENPFLETKNAPLSTFSIDVDTASYSNVRRYINDGSLPPKDAVRIEELVNYFEYDYPQPIGGEPFSVTNEIASCPWNQKHKLVSIGLQGKKVAAENTPPSNIVFLLDVSGSMNQADKLPLLKNGLRVLVNQLKPNDRVAIVVYAGHSGLVLPSTNDKNKILQALNNLEAGGSTNGGQGIQLAYNVAEDNFIPNGNNRVILATDGDFNVGTTNDNALVQLIEQKRQSNIFLSVLGFGTGNLNDKMMEKLADKGNGNYAYIDSNEEARKVLGQQFSGTIYTIAKDVKIQVEFNPAKVAGYRLLGYENRLLAARDFNDDKKDAGEIGAGLSVTALYEIVPAGTAIQNDGIELKYSQPQQPETNFSNELMTTKLRYKLPKEDESKLLTIGLIDRGTSIENASDNLKFATSVVQFGLLLRNSRFKGNSSYQNVLSLANSSIGNDLKGYRSDFTQLVNQAKSLRN